MDEKIAPNSETRPISKIAPISAAGLAYMGDAVFELNVRKMLLDEGSRPVSALNKKARGYVSASAQAAMYHYIEPFLTEEEQSIMRRGRNLHTQSKAKNADVSDYRHATGLEALFGYLFLQGEEKRLAEVFELCIQEKINGKDSNNPTGKTPTNPIG